MTGKFEDGQGRSFEIPDRIDFDPYPWQSFANWISSQLVRWDLQGDGRAAEVITSNTYNDIGTDVFLTDLARELAEEVGQAPPSEIYRVETLEFDEFNPSNPADYVKEQIKKYGV